jgi:tripartite motif-containing protein 71
MRYPSERTLGFILIAAFFAISLPARADVLFASTEQGVGMYDTNGTFIQNLALPVSPTIGNGLGGFIDPTGIAIGSDGSVYIADSQANTSTNDGAIYHFSAAGNYLGTFSSDSSLYQPQGIAFGPNGDLYVTNDPGNPYISAYDSSGNPVTLTGGTGGGPVGYFLGLNAGDDGIAFGPNGNFYIPDPFNGVDQYAADGTYIRSFGIADPLDGPSGVAIDASGNVFVTDVTNGNVVEFDSNGNYLATLDPSNPVLGGNGWGSPTALTFEPNGDLLISDDFGITQYDFSSVTAFSDGGGEFLAYDATVPEPSMVLLCVLGGLGLLVRRRLLLC